MPAVLIYIYYLFLKLAFDSIFIFSFILFLALKPIEIRCSKFKNLFVRQTTLLFSLAFYLYKTYIEELGPMSF